MLRAAGRPPFASPAGEGHNTAMSRLPELDPEVKPPDYRIPRGRSGIGAQSALMTLLNDLDRIRRAKEAYGDLPPKSGQRSGGGHSPRP